jgi:hypothetical protein
VFKYLFIIASVLFSGTSFAGIAYSAGKLYCSVTNPVEWISPVRRSVCEEQHVVQQQSGGGDTTNVVWWSASEHVRTDIWADKPWESSRPWLVFGFTSDNNTNLEKAYMLGTYGVSFSLFQHSYKGQGDSSLIAAEFDGASNALYAWSFIVNQPQKQINQFAYILDKGHYRLLIDWVLGLGVMALEIVIAVFAGIVGLVIGTVLNPLDTLFAIPSALLLAGETLIPAVLQIVGGLYRVVTGIF